VGYGPQPSQCIERLRELGALSVAGNHDRAATGALSTDDFNQDAATAARWTERQLTDEERSFLDDLPEIESQDDFTLVHGTLRAPIWEYLHSHEAALAHLERQESPFSLVGHTHIPTLVVEDAALEHGCELYPLRDGVMIQLDLERRMIINPGGVGQPRDVDPRASYAVYDTEDDVLSLHRVEYDIPAVQRLMEEAGLPRWLIERLAVGQ
jgi:diadenosine tetraphosphatase ApaH/serine/threonine PP2A family protein phosphatase